MMDSKGQFSQITKTPMCLFCAYCIQPLNKDTVNVKSTGHFLLALEASIIIVTVTVTLSTYYFVHGEESHSL